jgi:hypothetical protein
MFSRGMGTGCSGGMEMPSSDLIIALKEEIGNPDLFVGRKQELDFFLDWAFKTKKELSQSTAILARRKKGKTALVQRLFNILYTQNDPQVIPFYFKVEEGKTSQLQFSENFYQALLSQYFGYKLRDTSLIGMVLSFEELNKLAKNDDLIRKDIYRMQKIIEENKPNTAWGHARNAGHRIAGVKNERIIQVIDEFQYLNEYIYTDQTFSTKIELASFYQGTAESKVSPQIITGSYVGWLSAIIGHMVARYRSYYLGNLTDEDALAAVFNYANLLQLEVTDDTASFIAVISKNDPFYISCIIRSPYEGKDLTLRESVMAILKYETTFLKGEIAKVWYEYLWSAFERVNDQNAKKIVLYLAKYGNEERSREQILKDLKLDMSDGELEQKLHKLARADIIAYGSSNKYFRGLGDQVFEIVFRNIYEAEIEDVGQGQVEAEISKKLSSAEGKVSYYKGLAAEYRVINRLLFAGFNNLPLKEIVYNPREGLSFGRFCSIKKEVFSLGQVKKIEVDIFCAGEAEDGVDFVVEVKDWETRVTLEVIKEFIVKKSILDGIRKRKTAYIFFSERGLAGEEREMLEQNGIMYTDGEKLKRLEAI